MIPNSKFSPNVAWSGCFWRGADERYRILMFPAVFGSTLRSLLQGPPCPSLSFHWELYKKIELVVVEFATSCPLDNEQFSTEKVSPCNDVQKPPCLKCSFPSFFVTEVGASYHLDSMKMIIP